ncbi:MAG: hypothetical protein OEV78_08585 [Spirochaetia bacterium]|nr:hypothetical protein [Spirochaetia bacterium]
MKKYKIVLVCGFSIFFGLFCNRKIPVIDSSFATEVNKKAWDNYYNSIPELKSIPGGREYEIRVKRIVDPRLEDLSDEKYANLLKQIESDVNYYLGYRIKIKDMGKEEILPFFKKYRKVFNKPQFQYMIGKHTLLLKNDEDKIRLKNSIENAIKDKPLEIVKKYVNDKSVNIKDSSQLTLYFYNQFLEKYNAIGRVAVNHGKGLLRDNEYELTQQYSYWSAILNETEDADLFITNSIIAGADDQMPLYVINRGGITSGITENNIKNSFQGAIVLTLMPFISTNEYFNKARGNVYENLLIPIISMMAVHEFGHLLDRFDEYYDLPASPQNAPVDLRYQDWYQNIINGHGFFSQLRTLKKY